MDEVRLWNNVRTPEEILANYNKEIITVTAGLVGNYHFNQGVAAGNNTGITTATDESGNNNTGTLTGFTKTGATSNFIAPGAINKNTLSFGGDCNDNDASQYKGQLWYKDADNDGYSEGTQYTGCKDSVGFKPAYALKALAGDCNDNDAKEYPNVKWFKDQDGDGYIDGTSLVQCKKPDGYVKASDLKLDSIIAEASSNQGLALNFSSIAANYVNIPDNNNTLDLQNEFTIESWINPSDLKDNTIIDKGDYKYLLMHNPGNYVGLGFYRNGWIYNTMNIPANTWTHIALTYSVSNNEIKFYQNGVQIGATQTGAITTINDNGPVNIGRQSPTTCACNTFNGSMDDMRLWNKVRTAAEIMANYNQEITTMTSGLVGNYHFNQGIAAGNNTTIVNVEDASGNNNTGTLTGFTKTGASANFVNPGGVKTMKTTFTNLDCNDNNAALHPNQVWYRDFDGDTLGDPLVDSISCELPFGYVSNNFDINDSTNNLGFPKLVIKGNQMEINNRDTVSSVQDNTFFANICNGSTPIVKTFQVFNTGTDTLKITNLKIIGTDAINFDIVDTLYSFIKPKDSVLVNIRFTPSTFGVKKALFYVSSNDASSPIFFFKLEGKVRGIDSTIINDTICTGKSYAFNGLEYTTTGTYIANKTNQAGCDSTVTLNLYVIGLDVKSSITGKVMNSNVAVTNGKVILYQMLNTVATPLDTFMVSDGNYVFTALAIGEYKLKYVCGTSCGIVPTYFDATYQYQLSDNIKIEGCPTFIIKNININAIAIKSLNSGNGSISGNIKNGNTTAVISKLSSTNIATIDVYLVDDKNDIVGYTTSDANGDFSFIDIPNGDYKIIADLVGYKSDTTQLFTIGTLNNSLNASFCIDETKKNIGLCEQTTDIKPQASENLILTVFPNPSTGKFTISSTLNNVNIIVYNNLGVEILSKTVEGNSIDIDLSNNPTGLYILKVISTKGTLERSIIKN
jgi:hypothetical protein